MVSPRKSDPHLVSRCHRTILRKALSWPSLAPWLLSVAVLVLFLPTWVLHIRRTIDVYAFNDDARILIWPFFKTRDPTLFPQDPFVPYYQAGLPEGFRILYRLLAYLELVRPASEWIQYLSVIAVTAILAITARRLAGNLAGFLAVVLVLGSDAFFDRAGGGLPRAFAFPLISAGLYALVTARPMLLAGLTLAGAAFYPVVAALLGACLLVLLLVFPAQPRPSGTQSVAPTGVSRWTWRRRVGLLLLTLLGIVVLSTPMLLRLRPYGVPITPAMLSAFPEAGLGGRLSPEHHPPFEGLLSLLMRHSRAALLGAGEPIGAGIARWLRSDERRANWVVLIGIALAALRVAPGSRTRPELQRLWILPLIACALHPFACALAPRLFLPERYAQFAVPPFVVVLVAVACSEPFFSSGPDRLGRTYWHYASAVAVLIALAGRGTSWVGIEVYVPPRERPLYAAVANLPKNAVVAGWPAGPVENIPYLAQRRVLTNFQLEMPFHAGFTLQSRARLDAFFEAYFATSLLPIERLCTEYHVTHLLVDRNQFVRSAPDYYEPHRNRIHRLYAAAQGRFVLLDELIREPSALHFDGGLSLIELSRIPALSPHCPVRSAS